jgi:hypothetical protein
VGSWSSKTAYGFVCRARGEWLTLRPRLHQNLLEATGGNGRPSLLIAVPGSIDLLPPARKLPNGFVSGKIERTADLLEEWFARPEDVIEEGAEFFNNLRKSSEPHAVAERYNEVYRRIIAEPPRSSYGSAFLAGGKTHETMLSIAAM